MSSNSVQLKFIANGVYQKVPSKGLGDTIEHIAKVTGIKKVVNTVSDVLNIDCGCEGRKNLLNKLVPYKQK